MEEIEDDFGPVMRYIRSVGKIMDKKYKLEDDELMLRNDIKFVYLFNYIDSVYEGCAETMSVHKTYKGAYLALRQYLLGRYQQWIELPKRFRDTPCIESDERYYIEKVELKD